MIPIFGFEDTFDHFMGTYCAFYSFIFTLHYVTDWITSRMVSKRFKVQNYHDGFVVIGFDQILHYLQILFLIYILTGT